MQLRRVLRLVMDERGWWSLPRYLLGTSAGGSAAMILAARFPVQVDKLSVSPVCEIPSYLLLLDQLEGSRRLCCFLPHKMQVAVQ